MTADPFRARVAMECLAELSKEWTVTVSDTHVSITAPLGPKRWQDGRTCRCRHDGSADGIARAIVRAHAGDTDERDAGAPGYAPDF